MSFVVDPDYKPAPETLARYKNRDDELAELCEFWKFSYSPDSGYQGTCVFEMIDEESGEPYIRSVRVHPSKPVQVFNDLPPDGDVSVHVTMPFQMLSDVFWSRLTPQQFLFSSSVKVHGWAYASLTNFSLSFDSSTENWTRYYKWKDEMDQQKNDDLHDQMIGAAVSSLLVSSADSSGKSRKQRKKDRQSRQLKNSLKKSTTWIEINDSELDEWVQKRDHLVIPERINCDDRNHDQFGNLLNKSELFSRILEGLPVYNSDNRSVVGKELPSVSDKLPMEIREMNVSHKFDRWNQCYYRSPFSILSFRNKKLFIQEMKQSMNIYPHYLAISLNDYAGDDHDLNQYNQGNGPSIIRLFQRKKDTSQSQQSDCLRPFQRYRSSFETWIPKVINKSALKCLSTVNTQITRYFNLSRPDVLHFLDFV